MWYALIDGRNSCEASTHLLWGTLDQIANELIDECRDLIDSMTEDMDEDEPEEEYGEDVASLEAFEDCEERTEEMIRNFSFSLSDLSIEVGGLAEGYPALVAAYAEYAEDKPALDEWRLIAHLEESEEVLSELDEELRSLNDGFGTDCEMNFFIPNESEDGPSSGS